MTMSTFWPSYFEPARKRRNFEKTGQFSRNGPDLEFAQRRKFDLANSFPGDLEEPAHHVSPGLVRAEAGEL